MLFSSITYLFYFFAAFLLLYFAVPFKLKNAVLLVFSLIFYAWGGVKYALLMVTAILVGYVFGILIEKFRDKKRVSLAFTWLAAAIILAFMLYFKYTNFFIDNINKLTGANIGFLDITLPVGISFYTFQTISYVIDVYRGVPAQKNIIDLAAYVSMFPQLIAGPIVRYVDIAKELKHRTHSIDKAAEGIRRFVIGLGKKILIADRLSELCDMLKATDEKSVLLYWVYGIAVALYIYFDFSGYSDMAIGLGRMFGFKFLENFNYPYISKSATEFWRRWHISLGSWFRDYVYIPLGGNRKGLARQILNMFIVWALTGIWHGADWNFVCWGLYYFVLLTIEKSFLLPYLEKGKVWPHIYTLFLVVVGWAMFVGNEQGVGMALLFQKLFIPSGGVRVWYYLRNYAVTLIVSAVCCSPLPQFAWDKIKEFAWIKVSLVISLMYFSVCYIVGSTNSPFLYFNF